MLRLYAVLAIAEIAHFYLTIIFFVIPDEYFFIPENLSELIKCFMRMIAHEPPKLKLVRFQYYLQKQNNARMLSWLSVL